jgi:hypothetical protein
MKNTYRNFIISALVFGFTSIYADTAHAQIRTIGVPRAIALQPPACQSVPTVYIRNLKYDDYSRYTRMSTTSLAPGGFLQINTSCMAFDGRIVVTLQDVNRGPGFGVTAFQLTNVRVNGNTVIAQVPNHPIFRNRTFHVAIFVYGRPWKTANPGQFSIR